MQNFEFKYRVSVIVPIYNVEDFLRTALDSLVNQTVSMSEMEVLMVDDGSPDNSIEIMQEYSQKYPNFKVLRKENGGLSSARNFGIKHAQGKYLMYLDADDWYSPETIKSVADFFDAHYEEIDLVDIKIIPIRNGVEGTLHYRYKTLIQAGIYDLNLPTNWFIAQTTINICVKNLGTNNVLFDEDTTFHQEDQKYCTQVLQRKMAIGYCGDAATYYYRQQNNSITHTIFHAYYIFDSTMKFWENLFSEYINAALPRYIQALYISDVNWKTTSDILLPYHYSAEDFQKAKVRLLTLLEKVDDSVILNHPSVGLYRKHFLLHLKSGRDLSLLQRDGVFSVIDRGFELYSAESVEINIRRFKLVNDSLEFTLVLKSPIFDYFPEQPKLFLEKNQQNDDRIELPLRESSWNYSGAKIKTAITWLTDFTLSLKGLRSFRFYTVIDNFSIPCDITIDWRIPVHRSNLKPFQFLLNNYHIICDHGIFTIKELTAKDRLNQHKWYLRSDTKLWLKRQQYMIQLKKMPTCWLYYDCHGYDRNNGYFQFDHDFYTNDGTLRYYIINEDNFDEIKNSYPVDQQPFLVQFGSEKHRLLYLSASMIITAFIEDKNYNPFAHNEFIHFADLCRQHQLIYLQHGVLHAHLPWKYARDRVNVDYEVISTEFEAKNLIQNYGFTESSLIRSGMPRYDFIDVQHPPKRRILFAPSWRKYLISPEAGTWVPVPEKFTKSIFYRETQLFLNSPELHSILEKYDYYLDFKLHPIFNVYESLFPVSSPRVNIGKTADDADYSCYISDFSSYTFDFVYLKRPIIYFFPDYELFRAGMCDYRELDLSLEHGFGPLVETADKMIIELRALIENNCSFTSEYLKKASHFFLHYDILCRDRIYKQLSQINQPGE